MNQGECGVCTTSISPSSRRYGGKGCNKCGAFFYHTMKSKTQLSCINDSNDCLKVPNRNGIVCRKCRFAKCLEIGMSTPEIFAKKFLEEKKALDEKEKFMEEQNSFAHMANAFLTVALKYPAVFKSYINEENHPQFLNITLEPFQNPDYIKGSMHPSTHILAKHPITRAEFPTFCHFLLCQLEFGNAVAECEKEEMRILQRLCLATVCCKVVDQQARLPDICTLSHHFLNTFYAYNF